MLLPTYRQGGILWARLRAQSGKKELHPAIIITANRDIVQPEQFDPRGDVNQVNAVAVIGVSTAFAKYPPYVVLPHKSGHGGHPVTKLTAACGACIGWYDWAILEDDVEGLGGDVPTTVIDRIMVEIAKDLTNKLKTRIAKTDRDLEQAPQIVRSSHWRAVKVPQRWRISRA